MLFEEAPVSVYNPDFLRRARANNRKRAEARKEAEKLARAEAIAEQAKQEAGRKIEAAERNLAAAQVRVAELVIAQRRRHFYREIEARACKLFKVKPVELYSIRRNREIAFARQFICYWARRLTPLSLPQIGRLLGGKDHTTVLHGCKVYVEKRKAMKRNLRAAR